MEGPAGGTRLIGQRFFDELAAREGLSVVRDAPAGLMEPFALLQGPGFEPERVAPEIRRFYEVTSEYQLDVWSEWSGFFRPFGQLLALLFSRRLEQLNVPLTPLASSRGMSSELVQLVEPGSGRRRYTGWVRSNPATQETVYVGSYSVAEIPGHPAPCVKVVFPLPNGNATVIMRPSIEPDGSLVLESCGSAFGDPGFYFLVCRNPQEAWVKQLRTFREKIHVFTENDELRTDHVFNLWGRPFLRLHYRMQLARAAA